MIDRKIEQQVCEALHITGCSAQLLKEGYNNLIFLIHSPEGTFVARKGKQVQDGGSSLYNAFRTQKFFEQQKIQFVPRAIQYNEDHDIYVEDFVPGVDSLLCDMTDSQIDTFVQQLVSIHSLDYRSFQLFCKRYEYGTPEIQSPLDNLRIFGVERFEKVKRHCPDKAVFDWIATKLKKNLTLVRNSEQNNTPMIIHGDIGGNLRVDGQKVWIIDWEFSFIFPERRLAYINIHSHPTKDQFLFIVKQYARYADTSEEQLWKEIHTEERVIRLNDVIWAAMKWGECKGDPEQSEYFKNKTFQRMELFESMVK